MKRIIFCFIILLGLGATAQTTNINVNVNNSPGSYIQEDYTINGIPKSKDIGGVDITASLSNIEFGFISSRGIAYNGYLPVVNGVTLTNYNPRPVTVILQLFYKTNSGRRPYPRFYEENEKVLTVILPPSTDPNPIKYVTLQAAGSNFVTEITSVDMIVRPVQ